MKAFVSIVATIAWALPAGGADIEIALTDDRVGVDASFDGARLTLFGAVSGIEQPAQSVDIISVIRGPNTDFTIRQLERQNLIWMPGDSHQIQQAPGLYLTHATKPIGEIATLPDQNEFRLGAGFLEFSAVPADESATDAAHNQLFANAFITEAEELGLYHDRTGGIEFKKNALFAINVELPANTPVGEYSVSIFLYQNGQLLGRDSAALIVNKVGIERDIYEFAYQRPIAYGLFCVALSLMAGWFGSLAFRK